MTIWESWKRGLVVITVAAVLVGSCITAAALLTFAIMLPIGWVVTMTPDQSDEYFRLVWALCSIAIIPSAIGANIDTLAGA